MRTFILAFNFEEKGKKTTKIKKKEWEGGFSKSIYAS